MCGVVESNLVRQQDSSCKSTVEFQPRSPPQQPTSIKTCTTDVSLQEIYESLKEVEPSINHLKVNEETWSSQRCCPVHTNAEESVKEKKKKFSALFRFVKCLKMSAAASFVLCPPIPQMIYKKLMFHPPPKTAFYYLIAGEGPSRRAFFSAEDAAEITTPLSICLPHLVSPLMRCYDVLLQLQRVKVEIIETSEEHYLCTVLTECEKSMRRMKPLGVKRSPHLIIFSQPNSSDIGSCMLTDPNFPDMADFLQCDVLAYDYSGFGVSSGEPSEHTIYADIDAVWKFATEKLQYAPENIIILGFSIGTAASCYLAAKHPNIRALILLAPFTSFLRVICRRPTKENSCKYDKFPSVDRASSIMCKTLICHGNEDALVSFKHGVEMSKKIPNAGSPVIVKASHQGIFCDRQMWESVRQFVLIDCEVHSDWTKELTKIMKEKMEKTEKSEKVEKSEKAEKTDQSNRSPKSTAVSGKSAKSSISVENK